MKGRYNPKKKDKIMSFISRIQVCSYSFVSMGLYLSTKTSNLLDTHQIREMSSLSAPFYTNHFHKKF